MPGVALENSLWTLENVPTLARTGGVLDPGTEIATNVPGVAMGLSALTLRTNIKEAAFPCSFDPPDSVPDLLSLASNPDAFPCTCLW